MTCLVSGTPEGPRTFCEHTGITNLEIACNTVANSPSLPQSVPYFVIFCSTMSNALPLEAIKEEVKACKAISNDPQRLKCFDGLFMDTPSQPNAAEKERMKRTGKSRRANRQRMVVR